MSGRINDLIEQRWAEATLKFTPRLVASYSYAILNSLIRQWVEKDDEIIWERPSGTYCFRHKAFLKHGYPQDPFSAKTIRNFWLGDIHEATLVALAMAAGVPIKYGLASQLALNTVWGEGHTDGIIPWPAAPALGFEETEVLEVKSMAPWPSYNSFKKNVNSIADLSNEFGYRNQICMYVDAAIQESIVPPEGHIRYVAINKASMEICERELVYDPDIVDFCKEGAEKVRASKSPFEVEGLPPEEDPKRGGLRAPIACRFACSQPLECWEERGYTYDNGALIQIEGRP